jgi:stage II sporulation protein D
MVGVASLVRARWRACLLAVLVVVPLQAVLPTTVAEATAPAPPAAFRFSGAGFGHGIGMSQYGAYGMALNGYSSSSIIAHYYRGAVASPAALPPTISVGMLQAGLDPLTGGRLSRVLVRGAALPGVRGSGAVVVSGLGSRGQLLRRYLPAGVTWSIRPEATGMSVFGPHGRVFGPATLAGGRGLTVRYGVGPGVREPALLQLPQTGRTLRWGRLEVRAVRDDHGLLRPRAMLVIGVNAYLRGLAEMPSLWPLAALQAQAIAARSYALAAIAAHGQHRGQTIWTGCDCAVYPDMRDQYYSGWAKEGGLAGARWVAAVDGTGSRVVRWHGRVVQAFYSSSSGGMTQSNAVWGSAPLPYLPVQADPWDRACRGGACHNPNWRWLVQRSAASVSASLAPLGVGTVTAIQVTWRDSSGRIRAATVRGTRGTVPVSGGALLRLLHLKSTRFTVAPIG